MVAPMSTAAGSSSSSKVKRSRDPLSPKPILDRRLLEAALAERGIELKPNRIDQFYQLLHRQHYPSLDEFVATYKRREKIRLAGKGSADTDSVTVDQENSNRPFPNKQSSRTTKQNLHTIPKALLVFLSDPNNGFVTLTSKVVESRLSSDGTTTKLGVQLQDGHVVETVIMRHHSPEGSRATLCVSSQVGCAMGCTFCATGTMGIRGNLCQGEILEQIVHANHILAAEALERERESPPAAAAAAAAADGIDDNDAIVEEENVTNENNDSQNSSIRSGKKKKKKKKKRQQKQKDDNKSHDLVRNVVFMGMGEPLNNYDNVVAACKGLVDCRRWNLRHERVTVSTVGVTPKIRRFTEDMPELALALSLHAPNQEARSAIVPAAKAYPIEGLIDALDNHMMSGFSASKKMSNGATEQEGKDGPNNTVGGYSEEQRKSASKRKRAMIEYVMLEGETSSFECAHQLGKLCENRRLIVNLIPYNQTDVKDKLRCPPREHIEKFQDIVRSYGSFCYIRKTMGADIAGACGQLVVEKEQKDSSSSSPPVVANDIEDIGRNGKQSVEKVSKTNQKAVRKSESLPLDGNVDIDGGEEEGALSSSAELEDWIKPLAIATALAAGAFAISTIFILTKRRL